MSELRQQTPVFTDACYGSTGALYAGRFGTCTDPYFHACTRNLHATAEEVLALEIAVPSELKLPLESFASLLLIVLVSSLPYILIK